MQRSATIRKRPLFREQVPELLKRGGVRGSLATNEVDSVLELPSLCGHELFLLEQGNKLFSLFLREAKELASGQRRGRLSQLGRYGEPVHESRPRPVAGIGHQLRIHIHW